MIESDNFWHRKIFESVMSDLRNRWSEGIQELENAHMYCTDDDENNNEIDGIKAIDLCSISRCGNDTISEGKESAMQESQDKLKHNVTDKKVANFARDCPKACDNANIAQESEQNGKLESMLDLDNISVCEGCAMVCTELQYKDASKDEVVYGDQGINTEEYEKATYGNLMKTQSDEENEVKCTVAQ